MLCKLVCEQELPRIEFEDRLDDPIVAVGEAAIGGAPDIFDRQIVRANAGLCRKIRQIVDRCAILLGVAHRREVHQAADVRGDRAERLRQLLLQ